MGEFADLIPFEELTSKKDLPAVFGRLLKFTPQVRELKMFKNGEELFDEADRLNAKINDYRQFEGDKNYKMLTDFVFGQGIPIAPFPEVSNCLGLYPRDSQMTIKNGYAVLAFDYEATRTTKDCLFDIKKGVKNKEYRMAKKFADKDELQAQLKFGFKKAAEKLSKKVLEKVPPLKNFGIDGDNFDLNNPLVKELGSKAMKMAKDIDVDKLKEGLKKSQNMFKGFGNFFQK